MGRIPDWLRWFLILPGAVVAPAIVSFPIDYVVNSDELAGVGAMLRAFLGTESLGQLLQSFFAPVAFIGVGTWVAPKFKSRAAILLTGLYVAYTLFEYVQLPSRVGLSQQEVMTRLAESGKLSFLVVGFVLNVIGIAVGLIAALRMATPTPAPQLPVMAITAAPAALVE
jgi:hypothetical protein